MTPSMEQTNGVFQLMYPIIIRLSNPSLHTTPLVQSELGTIFALVDNLVWSRVAGLF